MSGNPQLRVRLGARARVIAVIGSVRALVDGCRRGWAWLSRGVCLFGATRIDRRTGVALSALVAAQIALGPKIVVVPVVSQERSSALAPFLPCMWSVIIGLNIPNRLASVESGRQELVRVSALRAIWIAGISVAVAAVQAILMVASGSWNERVAFNGLFFTGLTVIGSGILGARAAWFLPMLACLAFFFVGVDSLDQPRNWNILLSPPGALGPNLACLTIWLLSVVAYVIFDSRPNPDRESLHI